MSADLLPPFVGAGEGLGDDIFNASRRVPEERAGGLMGSDDKLRVGAVELAVSTPVRPHVSILPADLSVAHNCPAPSMTGAGQKVVARNQPQRWTPRRLSAPIATTVSNEPIDVPGRNTNILEHAVVSPEQPAFL